MARPARNDLAATELGLRLRELNDKHPARPNPAAECPGQLLTNEWLIDYLEGWDIDPEQLYADTSG